MRLARSEYVPLRTTPLFALLSAAVVLGATACGSGGGAPANATRKPAPRFRGAAVKPAVVPKDFALRDQSGRLVRLSALRGKIVVVSFLYTHCPDVCPLIASNLDQALRLLGPRARDVRMLAVSVDPKGDTPASVRRFVRRHRLLSEFRYLTGTRRQLAPIWNAYHVAVTPGGTIGHSAYELLVDQHGRGRLLYDSQVKGADVAHDVRVLLG